MGKRFLIGVLVPLLLAAVFPLTLLAAPAPTPTPYTWVAVTSTADLSLENIQALCGLGAPDLSLAELRQHNVGVSLVRAGTAFNIPSCCVSPGVFTRVPGSSAPAQPAPKSVPSTATQPAAPVQVAAQQNAQTGRANANAIAASTPVAVAVTVQGSPVQANAGAGFNLDAAKEFLAGSTQFGDYSVPNWLLVACIAGAVIWLFSRR